MKRRIFAAGLSLVAAATIVGSGFSAWYFGASNPSTESQKLGFEVTDKVDALGSFNSLTALKNYAIQLDQGGSLETTKGIRVIDSTDGKDANIETRSPIASFESSHTIQNAEVYKMKNAGYNFEIKYTVLVSNTFLKYADFNSTTCLEGLVADSSSNTEGYTAYTKSINLSNAATNEETNIVTTTTFLLTPDEVFTWKAHVGVNNGKPTTSQEYTAMVEELSGASDTSVFKFTHEEKLTPIA